MLTNARSRACSTTVAPLYSLRLAGSSSSRARGEHGVRHLLGQAAGEGVLLAGVVAAQQREGAERDRRPMTVTAPRKRSPSAPSAARIRSAAVPGERAEADDHLGAGQQRQLPQGRYGRQASRSVRQPACWPAARSGPRPRPSSRAASGRRRARRLGWFASPARCSAANSQSPERSPVNMRPVRLAPWAAGASPSTSIRARRVAEAGDRPPPVLLRWNAARLTRRPPRATRPAAGSAGRR